MSGNITDMNAVSLHVTNMERARAFYENGMGLSVKDDFTNEMGWLTYNVPNGAPIGIHMWNDMCQNAGGRPPNTVTGTILGVDDAQAFADRCTQNGGTLTDPIDKFPWGAIGGTIADPDGNEFVFSQPV